MAFRGKAGILLLSAAAAVANHLLGYLSLLVQTGLFFDTAFIITVTFSGGLGAGLLASLFTTAITGIFHYLVLGRTWFWGGYFYGLCFAATALVTWFFVRSFPEECAPLRLFSPAEAPSSDHKPGNSMLDLIVMLSLLSFALWIIISVMGALISVFNSQVLYFVTTEDALENTLKLSLLRRGYSLLFSEILARIPINIIDRPLSVLIGYGTSLLLKKWEQGL
jgi:hypothetical protein